MAFDGITIKAIVQELNNLIGCKIDKIYQPNKNNIILGLYGSVGKVALNICIDSHYYRIHLTTHSKPNPTVAPNFCMLLRKYLLNSKIKSISTTDLERVVIMELETFDEIYSIGIKKLIIELMGKHSNIILLDENNVIIDSLRHIETSSNSYRNIYPHQKYIFPTNDKNNYLEVEDYKEFHNIVQPYLESNSIDKTVSDLFTGFSKSFVQHLVTKFNINTNNLEILYNEINNIINNISTLNLSFEKTLGGKDYALIVSNNYSLFQLSFFIDDFYFEKENSENLITYRNNILKIILNSLEKYNKRLSNINKKLEECNSMDTYKLYGELLTANLYNINGQHLDKITLHNYYDNNCELTIPLDKKYTTNENAKKYFKKYNKLKNALKVINEQKTETINELNYIESIVYELETASDLTDIQEIFEEISENVIFKEKLSKNQKKSKTNKTNNKKEFNPIKYTIDGFDVYVGRNNKENDWLTTKFSNNSDIWFHTKDIHGSHVILKTNGNSQIDEITLIKCAELAAKHSKAKNSSNVPVDYCKIQYVKKPNKSKPGMVIYTNNKTLYVKP